MKKIKEFFRNLLKPDVISRTKAFNFLKFLGPGLLVTVGFIDPGNWASNIAAGSTYGYTLLWMVTLSTIMLILLQHNAAHLGIATGLCLSEATSVYVNPVIGKIILLSAVLASISTALAEILGISIAINMLFHIPVKIGALIGVAVVLIMLFSNSYKKLEKWIIGFVSVIGLSFLYEISLVNIEWSKAISGWTTPAFPPDSMLIIMSVLGAVVMPHNLFLHSEIIQSRQWNLENEKIIKKQLKYEFFDTLFSMIIGWAINSAMILLAAAAFFKNQTVVTELSQAKSLLEPLLGQSSSIIFALALLFSGFSSSITAGMAGGSIFAGIFKEPYDIKDKHSRIGVLITLLGATIGIFFIKDVFLGLIISQTLLSVQLPFTIFLLIYLTSSKKVMGKYINSLFDKISLLTTGIIVAGLNIALVVSLIIK
jgi:manganese transport protein